MKRKPRRIFEEPVINLTALIDVVFVVLIMFIIVAPLLEMDQVHLAESGPNPSVSMVQSRSPIQINVREDNTILYNSQVVTVDVLEMKLIEDYAKYPTALPMLMQDKRAQFGLYQSVKNAAEAAGFKELDVLLKPS